MNTILAITIPAAEPLPLPAPAWLLWSLLLLTFFLHLLFMNAVLGGSVITAFAAARRRSGDHRRLAGTIGKVMPTLVAGAITFGVAPLLFLQALYGRLLFTSSILMGWFWFAVVPILILAYYGTYLVAFKGQRLGRAVPLVTAGVALLFLTIAFIYVNNMSLVLRPAVFLDMFVANARGTQLNTADPTFVPRFLHMLLGAIAVAGLAIASYGAAMRSKEEAFGAWTMRHGAVWFIGATAVNIAIGTWWLVALPREVMLRFMGEGAAATAWFALGSLLGIGALVLGIMIVRGRRPLVALKGTWIALGGSLVAMILVRDEVRRATLAPTGFSLTSWTQPQWVVIAIFAILLVAALATTIWMALLLRRPAPTEERQSKETPVTA